jgi:Transglycosylase-like domain
METVSDGGRPRVNVSAGSQRTLPRALVLALLVGGSGGLLAQGHQAHADTGGAPGHQRMDLDGEAPDSEAPGSEPAVSEPAAAARPLALAAAAPSALAGAVREPLSAAPRAGSVRRAVPPAPGLLPDTGSLRVPTLLPVAVPGVASLSAVRSAAAPAAPAEAAAPAVGRHAARTRPADSGRSAHRRPGQHRAHSHRRDLPVPPYATGELNWTELARCEAGGNPHAVDPSGRYGGLYQFDSRTWHSLGGRGLPQDASPGEQTDRARELYQRRGLAPWPACGPRAAG